MTGVEAFCESLKFTGIVTQDAIALTPEYKECKAESIIGTIESKVTGFSPGECDYRLNATGTLDLECAAGKEVTFDVASCTIHIPAQKGLGRTNSQMKKQPASKTSEAT